MLCLHNSKHHILQDRLLSLKSENVIYCLLVNRWHIPCLLASSYMALACQFYIQNVLAKRTENAYNSPGPANDLNERTPGDHRQTVLNLLKSKTLTPPWLYYWANHCSITIYLDWNPSQPHATKYNLPMLLLGTLWVPENCRVPEDGTWRVPTWKMWFCCTTAPFIQ